MDKQFTIPTKDQVKSILHSSKSNGVQIAQTLKEYFKANFKTPIPAPAATSNEPIDLIDFATKLFNDGNTPGAIVA